MVPVDATYLPPSLVIGSLLAGSAGWGGRLCPVLSQWHATQDLNVYMPSREAVRLFQHELDVHKPSMGARN